MNKEGVVMFSKISLIVLMVCLVTVGLFHTSAAPAAPEDSIIVTLRSGDCNVVADGDGCDVFVLDGFGDVGEPGEPILPYDVRRIILPPNTITSSVKIEILGTETEELPGIYNVRPGWPITITDYDPIWSLEGEDKDIVDGKNMDVYDRDALYPEKPFTPIGTAKMRKWVLTEIRFYPIRYNPVTGEAVRIKKMDLKITYEEDRGNPVSDEILADCIVDDVIEKITENFDAARAWYEPSGPIAYSHSAQYNLVVLLTQEIKDGGAMNDWVAHKETMGHTVLLKPVEEIYAEYSEGDSADKVRKWLQDNYISLGIKYVMLLGSPYKKLYPFSPGEGWGYEKANGYPCDQYFADLDGSMLGKHSTWTKPLAPEVFASRGSTSASIISKMMTYEKPTNPDQSWRKKLWYLTYSGYARGFEGSTLVNAGMTDGSFTAWRDNKDACGIGLWHCHGKSDRAFKGNDGSGPVFFYSSDCSKLDNSRPIFHFAGCCNNGKNLCPTMFSKGAIATAGALTSSGGAQYMTWGYIKGLATGLTGAEAFRISYGSGNRDGWDYMFHFWADPSIKLEPGEPGEPCISITTPGKLPDGKVGEPYVAKLEAQSPYDEPPFTWALTEGELPPGFGMDSGTATIAGRPKAEGTYTFKISVYDSQSSFQKEFSLYIEPVELAVATESLLTGVAGEAYTDTLMAKGGTEPYTWTIDAGGLPAGLSLDGATGEVTGTPTADGAITFTAKVTDSTAGEATKQLTITILPEGSALPLQITVSGFLPDAVINKKYTATLTAVGGKSPYNWNITAGDLPTGLTLDGSTGGFTGIPTEIGIFSFTVQVQDQESGTDTKDCSIFVFTSSTGDNPSDEVETGGCNCSFSQGPPDPASVAGMLIPYMLLIGVIILTRRRRLRRRE
jgi:hypothetical protein